MSNLTRIRSGRLLGAAIGTLALAAGLAVGAHAAPSQQSVRIVAVAYPDLVGDGASAPGCPGCDQLFASGDQLAASSEPLPLLEFVLKDAQGAEIERRMTSALSDGRRPTSFLVGAAGDYTIELAGPPAGWSACPAEGLAKTVTSADFGADGRVQLDFHLWHGCALDTDVASPTPESAATAAATTAPARTATAAPSATAKATKASSTAKPTAKPAEGADVRGLVYIDLQSDGALAANDPGLGPVVVVLEGNGKRQETTTPPAGTYTFPGLPDGAYRLTVVTPAGYRLTTQGSYDVTVSGRGVQMGFDFGLFPVAGLKSLPVPPRTGPAPRLPSTGSAALPEMSWIVTLAALTGLLAALGLAYERRSGGGTSTP